MEVHKPPNDPAQLRQDLERILTRLWERWAAEPAESARQAHLWHARLSLLNAVWYLEQAEQARG